MDNILKKYKSFVACANADKILMINDQLTEITNEFFISNTSVDEISKHHCNDCYVKDDSPFVSVLYQVTTNMTLMMVV